MRSAEDVRDDIIEGLGDEEVLARVQGTTPKGQLTFSFDTMDGVIGRIKEEFPDFITELEELEYPVTFEGETFETFLALADDLLGAIEQTIADGEISPS